MVFHRNFGCLNGCELRVTVIIPGNFECFAFRPFHFAQGQPQSCPARRVDWRPLGLYARFLATAISEKGELIPWLKHPEKPGERQPPPWLRITFACFACRLSAKEARHGFPLHQTPRVSSLSCIGGGCCFCPPIEGGHVHGRKHQRRRRGFVAPGDLGCERKSGQASVSVAKVVMPME